MPVDLWFPTFVYRQRVPEAEALATALLPAARGLHQTVPMAQGTRTMLDCDVYTTFFTARDLHLRPPFDRLAPIILRESAAFCDFLDVDLERHRLEITSLWLNVYGAGQYQEYHTHPGNHLSGCYYLEVPPGSGEIVFASPLDADEVQQLPSRRASPKNMTRARYTPEPGMIVIFRSWLRHAVRAQPVPEERMSLAFNLRVV